MGRMLADQNVIITGATRGIGYAIAKKFAQEGANLIINGTNEEKILQNCDEFQSMGVKCIPVVGDISLKETSVRLVKEAVSRLGTIDCLVNNSGILNRRSFKDFNEDEYRKTMAINLDGMVFACHEVLKVMEAQGKGSIVNILSSASKKPHPNASVEYGLSKAAGLYLTRHLALEYAPMNIRVNAICPGPIETELVNSWTPEYREKKLSNIPLHRLGKPDDIANAAIYLATDLSDFMTGEAININGGSFMD